MPQQIAGNAKAMVDETTIYYCKGASWIPHYVERGVYVSPGGQTMKEFELHAARAVPGKAFLWPRHWQMDPLKRIR